MTIKLPVSHRSGKKTRNKPGRFNKNEKPNKHSKKRFKDRNTPSEKDSKANFYFKVDPQIIDCTKNKLKTWRDVPQPTPTANQNLLDPWQQRVLDLLKNGQSLVVDAPTSAGKTRAVEVFFQENINNPNFRAAYTTPVKSLSNDKLREFREKFGPDKVGIATGDIKENLNAPIVIATLECYRNSLLGVDPDLGRNLVVFDEYHYIQDESRGSAWEEAIILTPTSCQLLLLSASVKNAKNFVDWISEVRKEKCEFVQTEHRPVPLKDIIFHENQWIAAECVPPKYLDRASQLKGKNKLPDPPDAHELARSLVQIIPLQLTPTIVYCGRRIACEAYAKIIREASNIPIDPAVKQQVSSIMDEYNSKYQSVDLMPQGLRHWILEYGVAYHHSGLAPSSRLLIEVLLKKSLLRFCTATMGLSLGINFGVRSAIIADYQRPGNNGMAAYPPSEVLQMLGRAGRRGRDHVGFSLWANIETYGKMGNAKREECHSRLKNDPITFLGLVHRGLSTQQIENFYKQSFLYFTSDAKPPQLLDYDRLRSKLGAKLPCSSPASSFASFLNEENTACSKCHLRKRCHPQLDQQCKNDLAYLQLHLHRLHALDENGKLTNYGQIAKHFPQNGGLLISKLLTENKITESNMLAALQLFGSFCIARHKEIFYPDNYRFPFDPNIISKTLEQFYPEDLFPELYDQPWGARRYPILRDFNIGGGYIVSEWMRGVSWEKLTSQVCSDNFGSGDMTSLMFRVATYLISLSSCVSGSHAKVAKQLRDELLRPPLYLTI